jgi:hypothetical protein
MSAPLVLCACGEPAAHVDRDERPLCDRCNPGLNAPHPQAVRLPWPDWRVERMRKHLAPMVAGGGLDLYDLHQWRWLNTLDAVTAERDALRAAVLAYLAARERFGEDIPDGGLDAIWEASKAAEGHLLSLLGVTR